MFSFRRGPTRAGPRTLRHRPTRRNASRRCDEPGRSRSLSPDSVKSTGFRDLERLRPTGSSTRSPWSRSRVSTRTDSADIPSPGAVSRSWIRPRPPPPATTGDNMCGSDAACRLLLAKHDPRAHRRTVEPRWGARFLRFPLVTRAEAPDLRAACSGPKPGATPEGITHAGRETLDPACAQRRRGQLELLPDTSCRRRTVIRPWSGRARRCSDLGPLSPPRANEKASERPRYLRLSASSAEVLPPVGNRRAISPRRAVRTQARLLSPVNPRHLDG
jgi:hypothetical protein